MKYVPPTVEDVAAYAKSLAYEQFDSEAFVDHWEARGWLMRPGIPLKSWQAAVRTWQRNAKRWAAEKAAMAGNAKPQFTAAEESAIASYTRQAAYIIHQQRGYDIGRLYDKIRDALGKPALEEVKRRARSKEAQ
jgi:hypothetical protein